MVLYSKFTNEGAKTMTHSEQRISSEGQKASAQFKKLLSRFPVWARIPCAAIPALLISVIALLLLLPGNNGFIQYKQNIEVFNRADGLHVVVGKKVLDDTIDAPHYDQYYSSLDGKVAAFIAAHQLPSCTDPGFDGGTLYVVSGKKLVKVADNVYRCQLSNSGAGIAYVTLTEDGYSLFLYSVKREKNIDASGVVYGGSNFCISPDGKSVAYYDDTRGLMLFDGQKSKIITTELTELVGLSNNGKYIYAISSEGDEGRSLYSYNSRGEATRLGAISGSNVKFNASHTQIMFYREGKTYISNKGREGVKVSDSGLYLVTAPNSQSTGNTYLNSITYPVTTLYDHVYTSSDGETTSAWLIRKNPAKSKKLADNVQNCRLDASGKYMYFIHNNSELRVLKISHKEDAFDKSKKLTDRCDDYVVTSSRNLVYYMDGNTLYSVNGKRGGISRKIRENITKQYSLTISAGDVAYFISEDKVYACRFGFRESIVLFDVNYITTSPNGIVYASSDQAIHASTGSKTLKKIFESNSDN